MTSLNVVGLLVITDGRIVLERYTQGITAETRWTSWSVAKSVTSMLFGAAISDGHIKSLDEEIVKYNTLRWPEPSYTGVTLRHLLQMSSGVAWNGDISDPKSDVAQLPRLNKEGGFNAQVAYMGRQPRKAPAGTAFNYNTAEADIAAAVLRAATGPHALRLSVRENLAALRHAGRRLLDDDGRDRSRARRMLSQRHVARLRTSRAPRVAGRRRARRYPAAAGGLVCRIDPAVTCEQGLRLLLVAPSERPVFCQRELRPAHRGRAGQADRRGDSQLLAQPRSTAS